MKWKDFFPEKMLFAPSFHARVIRCPTLEVLQTYLAWRQVTSTVYMIRGVKLKLKPIKLSSCCHICYTFEFYNASNKGTQKEFQNELLFKRFETNYNTLPRMF